MVEQVEEASSEGLPHWVPSPSHQAAGAFFRLDFFTLDSLLHRRHMGTLSESCWPAIAAHGGDKHIYIILLNEQQGQA